ncbi:hypothetical protein TUM4438_08540 [Shewanella sairae]|uniref:Uncharacterized protein n=1 Tax=Shewanella sairae TaxID=190310 RepID=A0ABQ4P458_9GAMM|nr:hypothetical protein [Shewanella sairae]MCL1128472.1 hypothetical protein [Shewanella sairae]GIU42300.1 hypothetical protein TUM4438_08540 [Shewanella sairae]
MKYKVHFTLTIHSLNDEKAVFFHKKLELPFVPFIGLRLSENLGSSEPVSSIAWCQESSEFNCHIDSREVEMDDGFDLDLEYLIEEALDNGWIGKSKIYEV